MKEQTGISKVYSVLSRVSEELSESEIIICKAIKKYNQLKKFPLSDIEILEWKDSLLTIWPELDPEAIEFVVNKMIAQEIDCDGGGIQNIVKGLKRLDVNQEGNYFVKTDHTY